MNNGSHLFSCEHCVAFLSLIARSAASLLTVQEVRLQLNGILFSFFLLCLYKEGD